MALFISTTGTLSPVIFPDLGCKSYTHPLVEYNIELEFTLTELIASRDLWQAVVDGHITIKNSSGGTVGSASEVLSSQVQIQNGTVFTQVHLYSYKDKADVSSSSWLRMGLNRMNAALLQNCAVYLYVCMNSKENGKDALLRLQNTTQNTTLVQVSVSSSIEQWSRFPLSNIPTSGYFNIELQCKKGSGSGELAWAYLEITPV